MVHQIRGKETPAFRRGEELSLLPFYSERILISIDTLKQSAVLVANSLHCPFFCFYVETS
jgi:hypothetical protein